MGTSSDQHVEINTNTNIFVLSLYCLVFFRCRKPAGKEFVDYCVSKYECFYGWHLHLVCDQHGIPVSYDLLPKRSHVVVAKGYISDKDQQLAYIHGAVQFIPRQRRIMAGNTPEDSRLIQRFVPGFRPLSVNSRRWVFSDFMLAPTMGCLSKSLLLVSCHFHQFDQLTIKVTFILS